MYTPVSSCHHVHFAQIAGRRSSQETSGEQGNANKNSQQWPRAGTHTYGQGALAQSNRPSRYKVRTAQYLVPSMHSNIQDSGVQSKNSSNSSTSTGSSKMTTALSAVACSTMSSTRVPVRSRKQVWQNRIGRRV